MVVVTETDLIRTRALNTGMGWVTSAMSMQVFTVAHAHANLAAAHHMLRFKKVEQ